VVASNAAQIFHDDQRWTGLIQGEDRWRKWSADVAIDRDLIAQPAVVRSSVAALTKAVAGLPSPKRAIRRVARVKPPAAGTSHPIGRRPVKRAMRSARRELGSWLSVGGVGIGQTAWSVTSAGARLTAATGRFEIGEMAWIARSVSSSV